MTFSVFEIFPGRAAVSPVEAGETIGFAPKTSRNHLSRGTFPFPIVFLAGRKMVLVDDIQRVLDAAAGRLLQSPEPAARRPGRPRKGEVRP